MKEDEAMLLINHENSPGWTEIHNKLANKANGARTYSEMITKHYWPIFEGISMGRTQSALVTVTRETVPYDFHQEVLFVFLHERKTQRGESTIGRQKALVQAQSKRCRTIFIVWDIDWAKELEANGLEAIFLPMAIDKDEIREYVTDDVQKKHYRKILWFGNMWAGKKEAFLRLQSACRRHGWTLDRISGGKFNGVRTLTRQQTFQKINEYQYGVGVGRCAAEMATLGLKVFCYAFGTKGYLPMTEEEAKFLVDKNMLAREEAKYTPDQALIFLQKSVLCQPLGVQECQQVLIDELWKKGFQTTFHTGVNEIGIMKDKNKRKNLRRFL